MPMGLPPLNEAEVAVLTRWVAEGASWPEPAGVVAVPGSGAGGADYARDIHPIFESHCTRCHGVDLQKSQLRLDSRAGVMRGGLSGTVVSTGQSASSILVQRLTGALHPRMPFEGPPFPPAQIARIRAWIDAGAPGPAEAVEAKAKTHWAYVKPQRPEPPAVRDAGWVRNPIDRFVLARAEAARKRAEDRVSHAQSGTDFERARVALLKSLIRLQVASRARTRA
jgi:mono/diheme cytochrome c family protein